MSSCKLRFAPLAAAVALCLSGNGHAANIIVSSTAEGSLATDCTLQDAVTAINTQTAVNGCGRGDTNNDTIF